MGNLQPGAGKLSLFRNSIMMSLKKEAGSCKTGCLGDNRSPGRRAKVARSGRSSLARGRGDRPCSLPPSPVTSARPSPFPSTASSPAITSTGTSTRHWKATARVPVHRVRTVPWGDRRPVPPASTSVFRGGIAVPRSRANGSSRCLADDVSLLGRSRIRVAVDRGAHAWRTAAGRRDRYSRLARAGASVGQTHQSPGVSCSMLAQEGYGVGASGVGVGDLADLAGVGVAAEVETAGGVGAGGRGRARGVGRWRRGWCRLRPSECDELCRTVRPLRRVAGSRTLARMWRRSRRCAGEPNRAGRSEAGAWSDSRPMPMKTHRANAAIARAAATGDRCRAVGRMPESVGAAAIRPARARSRPGWRRHGR